MMPEYNGPEWYAPFAVIAVTVVAFMLIHGTAVVMRKWVEHGSRLPRFRQGLQAFGQDCRDLAIWREIDHEAKAAASTDDEADDDAPV